MRNLTKYLGLDNKDISSYIWLIFLQPAIYLLYKQEILFNTWVLLTIAILNFINVFLLASIVHHRYKESGQPQIIQVFLTLLNGFLTIILASSVLFQFDLNYKVIAAITILNTFILIGGTFAISRVFLKIWTPSLLKKISILKEILAMPLIILALEGSRTTLSLLYNNSFTDNLLVTILVITLIAGPICYFLFYFVIRASTTLTYPTKKWLLRYALFIASIFINFNIEFLENFIPSF
ncbi:hypothetical protein HOE67_04810 [Candidatus Peregrinibacteria bacterium]|jgi:hypothetical protein|nr:hypothetical protein [Candidatus Peregrinibacteria bacterium]MBT4056401.1 hypothetical protein [Candidatus Peregrinibacteria bacterium]